MTTERMVLVIDSNLAKYFRDTVGVRKGLVKGALSKAAEEAFMYWISRKS